MVEGGEEPGRVAEGEEDGGRWDGLREEEHVWVGGNDIGVLIWRGLCWVC